MTAPSRLIPISQAILIAGGLGVIVGTCPVAQVTFDLSAETDVVQYEPYQDRDLRYSWVLDSAEFRENQTGEAPSVRIVSGTLRFSPPVIVTVSRKSSGPLNIRLDLPPHHPARVVGTLDSTKSRPTIHLNAGAAFTLHAVEERAGRGKPVLLPVFGALTVGSGVPTDGGHPAGVRSGNVELLSAAQFKDTSVLVVRSVVLRPGDTFRLSEGRGSGYGFLAADERPLMNVGYRAFGKEARIERLHGETRSVTASASDVLTSDPFFRAVGGFVLILATLSLGSARAWAKGFRTRRHKETRKNATHT